jgi:hypothetical protein
VNHPELHLLNTPRDTLWGAYEAVAYFGGRLGVFDIRPLNVVKTAPGRLTFIHVIPCLFNREAADYFKGLVVQSK